MTFTANDTRNPWDDIAAGYDEFATPLTIPLAEEALHLVDLRPGDRFLDVAAGGGALSIPAARRGARVLATDLSPVMLARLEARARQAGLTDLETRVMDGQALELDDDTFDVSASLNGVSLFPDLGRGLQELARVTKPGGRVLVVAFGPSPKAEFLTFFIAAMHAAVPGYTGPPMDPPPLPFQLAEPQVLRRRLAEAGLTDVWVETVTWRMPFDSATHIWGLVTNSNPLGAALVADLTLPQRTGVQQVIDGMMRERSAGHPAAVLTTEMHIGIGTT